VSSNALDYFPICHQTAAAHTLQAAPAELQQQEVLDESTKGQGEAAAGMPSCPGSGKAPKPLPSRPAWSDS
jgi:hypothetical protein